jgi:flagellar biosynthetic protein FlhB
MADPQRTEQPTPRRLEKSRREGQFPVSKEFVSGIVFLCFVWLLETQTGNALSGARRMVRHMMELSFRSELSVQTLTHWLILWIWQYFALFFLAGLALVVVTMALQIATTGFGLSWKKLGPDLTRLNPLPRLRQMPSQNLSTMLQALLLIPLFGWIVYRVGESHWSVLLSLPRMTLDHGLLQVGTSMVSLLWKAAGVFFLLGCIDIFRQRRKWMSQLRMTKQEVREEQKEVEGNPLIRMRIRRLQREAVRRQMLQQVPKATAVIVNPTHYAVAIRYQVGNTGAPKVIAKGKNWLALRIREIAIKNQVPIVENPPLARALHQSAEVGQEIPQHLYQAVAEVLAYIYRLMRGSLPG